MLLRLDELNTLKGEIQNSQGDYQKTYDLMLDYLLLAYADGKTDVEEQLGGKTEVPIEDIAAIIHQKLGDKTYDDRFEQYFYLEDIEGLIELARNERQRLYNTAGYDTAKRLNAKTKTWHTMEDMRVRDTHDYIDKMVKPIDEPFYTYDGDSAMHPMGFTYPSNNINCRCWLTFSNSDITA